MGNFYTHAILQLRQVKHHYTPDLGMIGGQHCSQTEKRENKYGIESVTEQYYMDSLTHCSAGQGRFLSLITTGAQTPQ